MSILKEDYPNVLWDGKQELPIVVTFGAGVDSTAKLVNMWKLNIRPSVIIFADTGGERPDIYAHIEKVNKWCKKVDFPTVTVVKHSHKNHGQEGLLGELKRRKSLPSIAFGFKTCSLKYKTTACQRHIVQKLGIKEYIKTIGYGTGEIDRAIKSCESIKNGKVKFYKGENMKLWFPLIDWKLNRSDCKKLSSTVGFCTAKSSCFFCPAMKSSEVVLLSKHYPEQFKESVELEREFLKAEKERFNDEVCNAIDLFGLNWVHMKRDKDGCFEGTQVKFPKETKIKGLGRSWNWSKYIESYSPDLPFMEEFGVDMGCGCTDF